jgi:hypothetical protein
MEKKYHGSKESAKQNGIAWKESSEALKTRTFIDRIILI